MRVIYITLLAYLYSQYSTLLSRRASKVMCVDTHAQTRSQFKNPGVKRAWQGARVCLNALAHARIGDFLSVIERWRALRRLLSKPPRA